MYSEKMAPNNDEYSLVDKNFIIEELILKISSGDKEALSKLYEFTKTQVYGFCLSILKNKQDAEDIMQDVFIKVYKNADKYKKQGKPLAWILTITKNLSYSKLKNKNNINTVINENDVVDTTCENNTEDKMILNLAFEVLNDEERNIVILHANSGFKHREIAKLLDIPLSTVLSKYNRAIKKLKKEILKRGYETNE